MNYLDIILGIILLLGAINGFRKGFISELVSLAALVLGIWGAIKFSYIVSDFMVKDLDVTSRHMGVISFVITFIIIVILVYMLGKAVDKLIKVAQLNFINRLAGLVFGFIKSAFILSIVFLVFESLESSVRIIPTQAREKSHVYEPIRNLVPNFLPFVKFWKSNAKLEN